MLPEPDAPRSPGRRETTLWVLEEVAGFAAVFCVAIVAARAAGSAAEPSDEAALFAFHGALFAYAALRARTKLVGWLRPTRTGVVVGAVVGAAMTATGIAYGSVLRLAGVELPDVAGELRGIVTSPALLVLWGAVAVPIAEEIYFRGHLLDGARARFGTAAAVALTALAFALVHGIPVFVPAYLAFAWMLWKARERSGGLLAPILAHVINNLVGLVAPSP